MHLLPGRVKKLWKRKFTAQRLARIREAEKLARKRGALLDANAARRIFNTAEKLIEYQRSNPGVFIFPGQAMRPLYETVIGLDGIEGGKNRRCFRYVTMPYIPHGEQVRAEILGEIKKRLLDRKVVVPNGNRRYFIVDYKEDNDSFNAISRCIQNLAGSDASVGHIHQKLEKFGEGITEAEKVDRPTYKDDEGRLHSNARGAFSRDYYLIFEQHLRDYLNLKLKAKQARDRQIA